MTCRALAAAALALAIVLPGCGGGAPTKSAYIAQADRVCASAQKELQGSTAALQAALQRGGSPAQLLPRISTGLASAERAARGQVDRLAAIRRPSGAAGRGASEYLDAVRGNLDVIATMRQRAAQADLRGFQQAGQRLTAAGQRTSRLARDYGFRVCGRAGG
jgi:hypothetical protein